MRKMKSRIEVWLEDTASRDVLVMTGMFSPASPATVKRHDNLISNILVGRSDWVDGLGLDLSAYALGFRVDGLELNEYGVAVDEWMHIEDGDGLGV